MFKQGIKHIFFTILVNISTLECYSKEQISNELESKSIYPYVPSAILTDGKKKTNKKNVCFLFASLKDEALLKWGYS